MLKRQSVDLNKVTKTIVREEVRRLQSRARDYFYANHMAKHLVDRTKTIPDFYKIIVERYKLNNQQSARLKKGIEFAIQKELVASMGIKNIKIIRKENQGVFYNVNMENADFNNILRKKRNDNLVKQKKEKVRTTMQFDKDLHEAMKDYCATRGITLVGLTRKHFINLLEEDFES